MLLQEFGPVDGGGHEFGLAGDEGSAQEVQSTLGRHQPGALGLKAPADTLADDGACTGPGTPMDRQRRQAARPALPGERTQAGVGTGMVGLAGIAPDGRGRAEQDEGVECQIGGELVQQRGTVELGSVDALEPGALEPDRGTVVETARQVKDAAHRWTFGMHPIEQRLKIGAPGHVSPCGLRARRQLGRGPRSTGQQDHPLRPVIPQPSGKSGT